VPPAALTQCQIKKLLEREDKPTKYMAIHYYQHNFVWFRGLLSRKKAAGRRFLYVNNISREFLSPYLVGKDRWKLKIISIFFICRNSLAEGSPATEFTPSGTKSKNVKYQASWVYRATSSPWIRTSARFPSPALRLPGEIDTLIKWGGEERPGHPEKNGNQAC
jgi:hypothetical protein